MSSTIERLRPDDWQRFRRLRLSALRDAPDAFWTTYEQSLAQPESFWRDRLGTPRTAYFTTSADDGLVGVGPDPSDETEAVIISMWVSPDARGQGVGERLARAAIDFARELGFPAVKLEVVDTNVAAIRLYERLGFKPNGVTARFPPPRGHLTEHQRRLVL